MLTHRFPLSTGIAFFGAFEYCFVHSGSAEAQLTAPISFLPDPRTSNFVLSKVQAPYRGRAALFSHYFVRLSSDAAIRHYHHAAVAR